MFGLQHEAVLLAGRQAYAREGRRVLTTRQQTAVNPVPARAGRLVQKKSPERRDTSAGLTVSSLEERESGSPNAGPCAPVPFAATSADKKRPR